jgi:hypothetical protein
LFIQLFLARKGVMDDEKFGGGIFGLSDAGIMPA